LGDPIKTLGGQVQGQSRAHYGERREKRLPDGGVQLENEVTVGKE